MGSHHLRHDTTCENCGHTVEIAYCSNCGQKNVETRQSFGHLVSHFAEDLTHYDAAFWKTIKYLLFRPGRLTVEYLSGHRQRYVPPVKLYIFISFLAFLIPALLPDVGDGITVSVNNSHAQDEKEEETADLELDVRENVWFGDFMTRDDGQLEIRNPLQYRRVSEMDSVEILNPEKFRLGETERGMAKKIIALYQHNTPVQVAEKFIDSFIHNVPKAIFLYMPFFGFWLWLLHGKRRWLFFDHGIFTLHYFAFLLLCSLFISLAVYATIYSRSELLGFVMSLIISVLCLYAIFYFFRAHRRMYKESLLVNFTKSLLLFIVNIVSMAIWGIIVALYTYHNIH